LHGFGSCAEIATGYIELKEEIRTRSLPLWNVVLSFLRARSAVRRRAKKNRSIFFKKRARVFPRLLTSVRIAEGHETVKINGPGIGVTALLKYLPFYLYTSSLILSLEIFKHKFSDG